MGTPISALCLTHSSRFGLLQRSVINFLEQRHRPSELVIVVNQEGYLDTIRAFLRDQRLQELAGDRDIPQDIRPYFAKYREPAEGMLYALSWSFGEYVVCWDDDNLSHPMRLTFQVERTHDERASCFSESLYYFYDSDELFVTNYAQPAGKASERCAASSLMIRRTAIPPLDYGGKGTWSSQLLDKLSPKQAYDFIAGRPEMFIAGCNGNNSRGDELHRRLGSSLPGTWTREMLQAREKEVEEWLRVYRFPKADVDVAGKDAAAFQVTDAQTWPAWLAPPHPPADWHDHLPNKIVQDRLSEERREKAVSAKAKTEPPRKT